MIPLLLLSFLWPQEAPPPSPAQEEVRWDVMESRVEGEEVVYDIYGVTVAGEDFLFRTRYAEIRLDRRRYLEATGADPGVALPLPPEELPRSRFTRQWSQRVLGALGLPEDDGLLLSVLLEGDVHIENDDLRLDCKHLYQDRRRGTTVIGSADLLLAQGQGPGGWPFRILADRLLEAPDGSLRAERASVTTCDLPAMHYALKLDELAGRPDEEGGWHWTSAGAWLAIAGERVLPLPAPSFQTGESFLSLQEIEVHSDNRLGAALELELGGGATVEDEDLRLDWRLRPIFSSRRGFPLGVGLDIATDRVETEWDLFYLRDQGTDVHPYRRSVARSDKDRWRARLNHRFLLSESWRLDADFGFTSDILVDPEFFEEDWRRNDDVLSELYLRNREDSGLFEATLSYRTDDVGYAPLEGFAGPGGPAPVIAETLPVVRYESYATTLTEVPLGFLGGRDGRAPLNVRWGAELGRLQERQTDLEVAAGDPPFTRMQRVARDRASAWAEASLPLNFGGVFLRPGVLAQVVAYDENRSGTERAGRTLVEGFAELGTLLVRDWDHGWSHRVLPQVRFRDRGAQGEGPEELVIFDELDAQDDGQVVELSLRQFFLAPDSEVPWADIDLLVPFFPDKDRPLDDGIFPSRKRNTREDSWGPAELRVVWNPGVYGQTLEGVRLDVRWRQDLTRGELDELFGRVTLSPDERLSYGASLRKVNDLFSIGEAFVDWRISEEWGLFVSQPYNFTGNASKRSRVALQRYFHDFVVEAGLARNQGTGETGVFFNFTPRFLAEDPGRVTRSRMRR